MKVFISWSGRRSHEVAEALGPWLKKVIQSTDYWLSSEMERGVKWLGEINKSLDEHSLGILCVTPGNKEKPWLLFEAGALSKQLGDEGRVIPYLLDFYSVNDLREPLAQFNAALADEVGTWQIVKTLNAHAQHPQDESSLRETFDLWWPKLGPQLDAIKASSPFQPPERRTTDDKIDELLGLMRSMQREFVGDSAAPTQRKKVYRLVREMADPELFDELDIFHTVLDVERDIDDAPFVYGENELQKSVMLYVRRNREHLEEERENELRDERIRQAFDDAGRPGEDEDREEYSEEASEDARAAEADMP